MMVCFFFVFFFHLTSIQEMWSAVHQIS